MSDVSIRSVTLHLPRPSEWNVESLESFIEEWSYKILEAKDKVIATVKLEISSLRLTLPDPPLDSLRDLTNLSLNEEEVLVSIGSIPPSVNALEEVVSSLANEGIYSHVTVRSYGWETFRRLARLINRLSEDDPEYATKFGINLGGKEILTPFYPLSWSPGREPLVTVSLTYPKALEKAFRSRGIEGMRDEIKKWALEAVEIGKIFSLNLKVAFRGVDLSVAPWMENSSLGLIESVAGVRLPEPGIAYGIRVVNDAIKEVSKNVMSTGFNQVQLPLGEDLKLKARAAEGELKARDLARLSGACLAGLDMVVVPFDEIGLAGLMFEVLSYIKPEKLLGFRVISLEGIEPGDKIMTKRFGEIPVISI